MLYSQAALCYTSQSAQARKEDVPWPYATCVPGGATPCAVLTGVRAIATWARCRSSPARRAHLWEEPCISGTRGSGTVFFSGCALGCVFCQNESISHHSLGRAMNARELSELFARVEELGVHNLNLVTPSHFAPVIFEALRLRRPGIPVVWNSSGYETVELVEAAARFVDVFLPDLKYFSSGNRAAAGRRAGLFSRLQWRAIRAMCQAKARPSMTRTA